MHKIYLLSNLYQNQKTLSLHIIEKNLMLYKQYSIWYCLMKNNFFAFLNALWSGLQFLYVR